MEQLLSWSDNRKWRSVHRFGQFIKSPPLMHIKGESDGGYHTIHIHVVRLRNTREAVIWISITRQPFWIWELKFQMNPFPLTSFDSSSRSQRIHFLPSTETISDLSKTQPDLAPFSHQLWIHSSDWRRLVCVWWGSDKEERERGMVQSGIQYEFPSGVTGNQCGSAAVCALNWDAAEV